MDIAAISRFGWRIHKQPTATDEEFGTQRSPAQPLATPLRSGRKAKIL